MNDRQFLQQQLLHQQQQQQQQLYTDLGVGPSGEPLYGAGGPNARVSEPFSPRVSGIQAYPQKGINNEKKLDI